MSLLNQHLPVLPVAIPMMAAALMVMLRDKRRHYKLLIAFSSLLAQLFCAVYLLLLADGTLDPIWPQSVGVYLLGDWPAPFGIVLVVDRLAAFLLVLTNVLAFCCWFYSCRLPGPTSQIGSPSSRQRQMRSWPIRALVGRRFIARRQTIRASPTGYPRPCVTSGLAGASWNRNRARSIS